MDPAEMAAKLQELQEAAERATQLQRKADIKAAAAEHKSAGAKRMVCQLFGEMNFIGLFKHDLRFGCFVIPTLYPDWPLNEVHPCAE